MDHGTGRPKNRRTEPGGSPYEPPAVGSAGPPYRKPTNRKLDYPRWNHYSVPMNTQEKRILFFASSVHFFTHFYILVFPALVMPMSRALSLPLSEVLNYSFWMYLLYGIMAIPWGALSDRWGHKPALSAGIILAGAGMVFAGLSANKITLVLAFALVGVGCSAFHPAGTALVSQGIRERGRAMGINGIWGTAGMAMAPFLMSLLNYFFEWQRSLVIIGVAGLILGVSTAAIPFSVEKGVDVKKTESVTGNSALKLFILFISIMVAGGFMYRSFSLILPSFIEYRLGSLYDVLSNFFNRVIPDFSSSAGFETLTAGILTTGIYLFGILGQYVGGRAADRYSLKWAYFFFFLCATPFVAGMYIFKNAAVVPLAGMFLFFTLGMQPIENSLIAFLTPARFRSVSYGVKFTLNFGIGSFAVKLSGLVEQRSGIDGVILLVGGFLLLVIAGISIFLAATRGQAIRH